MPKPFWNNPFPVVTPNGTFRVRPVVANPVDWSDPKPHLLQWGRVIVGFNVGREPTWNIDDIEREWHEFAKARNFPRDVTIVPQRGAFTDEDTGDVIQENGATLTVLNIQGKVESAHFSNTMMKFGEHLAEVFRQKSVIVQLGRGSRTYVTYGMRAFNEAELRRAAKRRGLKLSASKGRKR